MLQIVLAQSATIKFVTEFDETLTAMKVKGVEAEWQLSLQIPQGKPSTSGNNKPLTSTLKLLRLSVTKALQRRFRIQRPLDSQDLVVPLHLERFER
eukprot:jgi/Galph1/3579/GphlegSOOS_G2242.1